MNGAIEAERIRLLIVGESPIARAGLAAAIADSDQFQVVGTCNLAASAALLESTAASAVLLESAAFSAWHANAASDTEPESKPPAAPLTPREIEVLRMMADGASNKVIAHQLAISEHTVKFHVTSILGKLNAGTRTEAVMLGVRKGLVYL